MKKFLLVLAFFSVCFASVAQAPVWQWAKKEGGYMHDQSSCMALDQNGNMFVAGYFSSAQISFGMYNLSNVDGQGYTADIFLVKYSSNGTVLWAKAVGVAGDQTVSGIAVDNSGNCYIVGSHGNTPLTFGNITLTPNSAVATNIFIVKYDPNGNVLWANQAGSNNTIEAQSCSANGVSVDGNGNCYVTGSFNPGDLILGGVTLTNPNPTHEDIYIMKCDPNGTVLWARSAGSTSVDKSFAIATDNNGNSYVAGTYSDSSITIGGNTLPNAGNSDILIIKYDLNGNVLWAKKVGGSSYETVNAIAVDGNGNCFITGNFKSASLSFGSQTLSNGNTFTQDVFLAKYDSNGNFLWARSGDGFDEDQSKSITIDASGNSYITGFFTSVSITFGSSPLWLSSANGQDGFVVKYDPNGNELFAQFLGGGGPYKATEPVDIVSDANSNIYLTGGFTADNVYIGNFILNNTNPNYSSSMHDIFIWKLCNSGSAAPTITSNGPTTFCNGDSVTLSASAGASYLWNDALLSTGQNLVVRDNQNLIVTVIDANNCSASSPMMQVVEYPQSDTTVTKSGSLTFCQGDSVILSGSPNVSSYSWSNGSTSQSITAFTSQLVNLTVTDANGCVASSMPELITVNPLPPAPVITSGTTTVCYPGSVTLTSSAAPYIYWSNGPSTQSISVSSQGSYQVTIYDLNGCHSTSLPVNVDVLMPSFSTESVIACNSYVSPSGNDTWITSGIYHDTLQNAVGCDSVVEIHLTVNSSYYTTNYDSTLNVFTLFIDPATMANAVAYHWEFGDGTSSLQPNPTHLYTVDSVYNVCMRIYTSAGDSCEYCHLIGIDPAGNVIRNSGFILTVRNSSVGFSSETEKSLEISVFPNPFGSTASVHFSEVQNNAIIRLSDVLGKEVLRSSCSGTEFTLEKGSMHPGIYFLELLNESGLKYQKKIIIQ
jgi:hypothetical protein